jgi:hypothetical protein
MKASVWIALVLGACSGSPKPAMQAPTTAAATPAPAESSPAPATPTHAAPAKPVGESTETTASEEFFALLSGSRPAIHDCYIGALKQDNSLASQPITLEVTAVFSGAGKLTELDLSPSLGVEFETCVRTESNHWKLTTKGVSQFKAKIALTPT